MQTETGFEVSYRLQIEHTIQRVTLGNSTQLFVVLEEVLTGTCKTQDCYNFLQLLHIMP